MRLTLRRLVICLCTSTTLYLVFLHIISSHDDDSHRPRPNIKPRRGISHGEESDDGQGHNEDDTLVLQQPPNDKQQVPRQWLGSGNSDLGKLVDWHDREAMERDAKREGRGERDPVVLTPEEAKLDKLTKPRFGYSQFISDMISLDRSIRDIRHPLCNKKLYHENLPDTSVVLPFFNEAPSVLLRSVHSILNKTPAKLLREIILVDDASFLEELKVGSQFETDLLKLPKTVLLRSPERTGLTGARTMGAKVAKAQTITFLDSHVECSYNWLPPLLDRIARNWKSVPQPMIDGIDAHTFYYDEQPGGVLRGSFSWDLLYKRLPINKKEKATLEDEASPIRTPVQAGGLFSIHKDWFWELGGYDPFLKIWGAEQYEMSFKVWMCGGEMEEVPCSRVGHIYRSRGISTGGHGNVVGLNHARIAELWMDEYKKYYLDRNPYLKKVHLGDDLEERRKIRERLKCRSFKWYMENIAYDQGWYYPAVVPPPYASGQCISKAFPDKCFHISKGGESVLVPCSGNDVSTFHLTWRREIKSKYRDDCVDLSYHAPQAKPQWFKCHEQGGNQKWLYMKDTEQLKFDAETGINLCISTDGDLVFMDTCDPRKDAQKWTFTTVDFSLFKPDLGPPYDRSLELKS